MNSSIKAPVYLTYLEGILLKSSWILPVENNQTFELLDTP